MDLPPQALPLLQDTTRFETVAHGGPGSDHAGAECPVCSSEDVHRDEVLDRGTLHLAECQHCEHRWTSRAPVSLSLPGRRLRRTGDRPVAQGVASAA